MSENFGKTVKGAIQWLVNDKISKVTSHYGYSHAIKTYALSEAYAMTGVSVIAPKMNECMEFLIAGQQTGGSFDYSYNKDNSRQDLSLAGWHYQAMKAAYGAGCEVESLPQAIQKSIDWLKGMGRSSVSLHILQGIMILAVRRENDRFLCVQWVVYAYSYLAKENVKRFRMIYERLPPKI